MEIDPPYIKCLNREKKALINKCIGALDEYGVFDYALLRQKSITKGYRIGENNYVPIGRLLDTLLSCLENQPSNLPIRVQLRSPYALVCGYVFYSDAIAKLLGFNSVYRTGEPSLLEYNKLMKMDIRMASSLIERFTSFMPEGKKGNGELFDEKDIIYWQSCVWNPPSKKIS